MKGRGQLARLAQLARRSAWLSLLASLLGLLASVLPAAPFLAFTAAGMQRGELWRLWTGHFVHYGSAHLWGDWLAFVVWATLVEGESRLALGATLLIGAPLLLLALELVCPALGEYRGLSGLDTALVVELILLRGFLPAGVGSERGLGPWLTRQLGRPALRVVGGLSLGLSLVKIAFEFQAGHAVLAHDLGSGVKLLPAAHAFGALLGLWIGLSCRRASSKQSAPHRPQRSTRRPSVTPAAVEQRSPISAVRCSKIGDRLESARSRCAGKPACTGPWRMARILLKGAHAPTLFQFLRRLVDGCRVRERELQRGGRASRSHGCL